MILNLFKSILHNIGVLLVGFVFAFIGKGLDIFFGIKSFNFPFIIIITILLLILGFLIRVWATLQFYEQRMKVISLKPQKNLITTGAFGFSRNPLYLGGNVFIFFGAALFLGSPVAVVLTVLNIILLNIWMIPREERQLKKEFGQKWLHYEERVRRWL